MLTRKYFLSLALVAAVLGFDPSDAPQATSAIAQGQAPSSSSQVEQERSKERTGTFKTFGFVPPSRGSARRTVGLGSRGGTESQSEDAPSALTNPVGKTVSARPEATLSALSPSDHVGQTVSGRPTFAWHLSQANDEAIPVVFGVQSPVSGRSLYEVTLPNQRQGFSELVLPSDVPALQVGQTYRWFVKAVYDSDNESGNPLVTVDVRRVAPSDELSSHLSSSTTPRERAFAFAQAGIWYDALSTLSSAAIDSAGYERDRLALLNDVGIDVDP